jgi:L-ribulokinase
MLNSRVEQLVPGVAGVVEDGILPSYFGYETGQASVGDAFAWVSRILGQSHDALSREAASVAPGSGGVMAIDWLNGCRTPLMDGRLTGGFIGLSLGTAPGQLYRAMIEATAFGVRWICDTLRDAGVPVRRYVASGGLPKKSPLLMQIYADVLGEKITVASSDQPVALGAAILGAMAAGEKATGHNAMSQVIQAMAPQTDEIVYHPDLAARKKYNDLYTYYRNLTHPTGTIACAMRSISDSNDSL